VGVLIGVAALILAPGPEVAVALVILCTGLAELTVARNYALGVMFATPVALLFAGLASPLPPLELARDRLLDTAVGAVVAVAVALLLPNRGRRRCSALSIRRRLPWTRPRRRGHDSGPDAKLAAARTLAARLSALRATYDAAAGDPWSQDIPVEKVLTVERRCHTALARLTR